MRNDTKSFKKQLSNREKEVHLQKTPKKKMFLDNKRFHIESE